MHRDDLEVLTWCMDHVTGHTSTRVFLSPNEALQRAAGGGHSGRRSPGRDQFGASDRGYSAAASRSGRPEGVTLRAYDLADCVRGASARRGARYGRSSGAMAGASGRAGAPASEFHSSPARAHPVTLSQILRTSVAMARGADSQETRSASDRDDP